MNWIYFVPLATFLYLVLDLYSVIESFEALFRSGSFWMFWILFTLVDLVAFVILSATGEKSAALDKLHLGPGTAGLLTLFFATIGTVSIVQSFSLKFADHKAVDLERMFEQFRSWVLKSAAAEKAGLIKNRRLRLVRRLVTHYKSSPEQLEADYITLMVFGGRSQSQISKEIAAASTSQAGKEQTLSMMMVSTDERGATQILVGRRVEKRQAAATSNRI